MARTSNRTLFAAFAVLALTALCNQQAVATRVSPALSSAITGKFADARIRLDGSIETKKGELYLPIVLPGASAKATTVTLDEAYPSEENPDVLIYSNGWCFLRIFKKGVLNTVVSPNTLPEKLRKQILSGKMPADLLVPDQMILPRSLKPAMGELTIPTVDDSTAAKAEFGQPPIRKAVSTSHGAIFVTSPKNGDILLLDEHTFSKIGQFPTEGTPSGMAAGNGKLYVADQTKSKIHIFDLKKRLFIGSIKLTQNSAPKGLAMLPNGKLLYISESASNDVAVVETATDRLLLRTRVPAGPARMAITPNGFQVVVLNAPCGQATILSTLNQRVIGTVSVGSMPNSVVIGPDSARAYVTNRMSNTVSVIDIMQKKVVETIKTGSGPTGLVLSADGTKLYVANAKDNTIGVFDLKTRQSVGEARLPLDVDFPGALGLLPGGKQLLITSESTDAVGVLNLEDLQFAGQPVIGQTSDELLWVQTD